MATGKWHRKHNEWRKKINNKKHACLCTFMLGFYMMERNLIIINSFRAISDKKHIHLQIYIYTLDLFIKNQRGNVHLQFFKKFIYFKKFFKHPFLPPFLLFPVPLPPPKKHLEYIIDVVTKYFSLMLFVSGC